MDTQHTGNPEATNATDNNKRSWNTGAWIFVPKPLLVSKPYEPIRKK